jgi:hypothetical protein
MMGIVEVVARAVAGSHVETPVPLPSAVQLRRSRLLPWLGGKLAGMTRPPAAVTLGRVILVHPDVVPSERLLRHELAHVEQWSRHPLIFPFSYIRAHIRHGYRDNPYEIEARVAERRVQTGDTQWRPDPL